MSLVIADEVIRSTHMSEAELRREIAVMLFAQDKLTLAQAAHLAEMDRLDFQHLLASRQIPLHYDLADFEEDLETLARLSPA